MEFLHTLKNGKFVPLVFALLLLLGIIGFTVSRLTAPIMVPMYSDLSIEDSNMIISRLQSMEVPYESTADGKQIMVPSRKVFNLRMAFAQDGIPHSGNIVGYEIFDKSEPLGSSQFVHNVNLVRALEGELIRTIASLNPIEHARVHLVIPKKELFSKLNTEPTASVVVKTKGGQNLSRTEVAAISYLVAHAVPGLNAENVAIVDNLGRPLKIGSAEMQEPSGLSSTAAEYQLKLEEKLESEITELVERSVGIGKAKVNVAAAIDFDREVVNTETFDPNGQVLRSRKVSEEADKENAASDSLSVANNLPNNTLQGSGTTRDKSRTDEITNYEISRTISNKVVEGGHVKKLSIAVIVDGIYDIDPQTGVATYKERNPEEMAKLRSLIISAVGFDAQRGDALELANLRFASEFAALPNKESITDWIKSDLQNVLQTVVIGVVMILVLMLIIRPIVTRTLDLLKERHEEERQTREAEMLAKAEAHVHSNVVATNVDTNLLDTTTILDETRRSSLIKRLNEAIEQNPEDSVAIIRNWLYQE